MKYAILCAIVPTATLLEWPICFNNNLCPTFDEIVKYVSNATVVASNRPRSTHKTEWPKQASIKFKRIHKISQKKFANNLNN